MSPTDLLRLPGFGGAAVTLRAHRSPVGRQDSADDGLVLDIGLLDPRRHVQHLNRPCSLETLERLAAWLLAAAGERHPEHSLGDFQDASLGMALSVVGSSELQVELDVLVVEDLDADPREHDGMGFQTSRAVMVTAAQQATALADVPTDVHVHGEEE